MPVAALRIPLQAWKSGEGTCVGRYDGVSASVPVAWARPTVNSLCLTVRVQDFRENHALRVSTERMVYILECDHLVWCRLGSAAPAALGLADVVRLASLRLAGHEVRLIGFPPDPMHPLCIATSHGCCLMRLDVCISADQES